MTEPPAQTMESTAIIDKSRIADSFSRAAHSYDSMAAIQRRVGQQLLQLAAPRLAGRVMDLGCGTGYFTTRLAASPAIDSVLALDLAEGMLSYARQTRPHQAIQWLCADAECLPLADDSIDSLFSSFSIQWCVDLDMLFAELARVLKPGAVVAIATLGPDTLHELRGAWAQVDDYVHVNRFHSRGQLQRALQRRFRPLVFEEQHIELEYQRLKQLTDELKGIGAHNLNPGRIAGLAGRQRIQTFRNAYEQYRKPNGLLPATYQVFYGLYQKRALAGEK